MQDGEKLVLTRLLKKAVEFLSLLWQVYKFNIQMKLINHVFCLGKYN